LLDKSLTPTCL